MQLPQAMAGQETDAGSKNGKKQRGFCGMQAMGTPTAQGALDEQTAWRMRCLR